MVHTRGQGARPEGFSEYQPPKRERKMAHSHVAARTSPVHATFVSRYKDASTQTEDVYLTTQIEHPGSKRRREDDDSENSSKRQRQAVTPEQPRRGNTFMFSATRNRSLLTSAPPKIPSRRDSPYGRKAITPVERTNTPPKTSENRDESDERAKEPETPNPAPARAGGLFGSVRKIFGYLTGGPSETGQAGQTRQSGSEAENVSPKQTPLDHNNYASDMTSPTPRTNDPALPPSEVPADDSVFTKENWKRRRAMSTRAGREALAALRDTNTETEMAQFNPTETPGTNKRKLASFNGEIPPPTRGGFGIDENYLDVDNEVDGLEESRFANDDPSTPANKTAPQTPLRSALRANGYATLGRSGKSVRINPQTSVKHVYGTYGRSGIYHGSMFSDPSDRSKVSDSSASSISARDVSAMHSPSTLQNTVNNMTPKFRLDHSVVDPNDTTWRPSLANPSPGHFRVPDMDEYEDEEDTIILGQANDEVIPPRPSTPRMSHAELPGSSSSLIPSSTVQDESSVNDTTESRLEKARSEAQKYKPVRSSRLSLTEKARSRSSSPPGEDVGEISSFRESQIEVSDTPPLRARTHPDTPNNTTMSSTLSPTPKTRKELDNTNVGTDGMTDYQREHQYDEWAAGLDWPQAQTYVEAGIASQYIDNLVRKNWTERDTEESAEFWAREFDRGEEYARQAAAEGKELVWITDPEEMIDC
ncbi:hypothetical protein PV08_00918 [Exophiala spinifera]|uniref:Uncharacterized protein n=1 Tax=Exophiala spinifera TaxID=91928 RepID=A0A0D2BN26_9EURO|nr:uncharacterized protein PV08_00918 [Exophiala spinifera]KIW20343.1 hypothetical protein PV08_00918 [Exophiala spinifera]